MPQLRLCTRTLTATVALLASAFEARAGQELLENKAVAPPEEQNESSFRLGAHEFQVGAGAYFFGNFSARRPHLNDVDASVRVGWMLGDPSGDGCFRGNFEHVAELMCGAVVEGPGNGFGGMTMLLRYNFVQPDARLVPYAQIGAGVLLNDIHTDRVQQMVGGPFSFNLQGGFGVRNFCAPRCAEFIEANYRHFSNAQLYDRNDSLNSVGALIGLSRFF